jgi:acetoin utilization deacetylase AcuC-like enzyme
MRFGYREACLAHQTGDRHPEHPDRLRAIRQALSRSHGVEYVEAASAAEDALRAVHDPDHVEKVREFCADGGGHWDGDTIAVEATWEAALASAGLACWAGHEALDGADGRETPFALGRPPGHHAPADEAMGFCFFNNVAVAAQDALGRDDVERVAVFDWDVHHGNGTQDIFYDRGDVFYASIHERDLFPGTGEITETGYGPGKGTTMNFPYPSGSGDAAFLAALEDAISPALERFDPDLLFVSAGFDAHERDPISRLRVTTEGYGQLTDRVRSLAERMDAALAFVLEGGYGLEPLADSIETVHETFDGRAPVPDDDEVSESARDVVDAVRAAHGLGEQ